MQTHQENHLYPCQLALVNNPQNQSQKFIFHSPINTYSIIHDPKTHQSQFLDHDQVRYSTISNIIIGQKQRYALMSNPNIISFVGTQPKILHSIHMASSEQIISDIITLPENLNHSSFNSTGKQFSLVHLIKDNAKSEDSVSISVKRLQKTKIFKKSNQKYTQNPQSEKFIKTKEDQGQIIDENQFQVINQLSSTNLHLPFSKSTKFCLDSFQLSYNHFDGQSNSFGIFEKQSSILFIYDPEYETFTNAISCSQNSDNRFLTEYQSNKFSYLTNNIVINSHAKGIIQLMDLRTSRIVHVRNLLEEITAFGQRPWPKRQQNIIKFWNSTRTETQDQAPRQTSQFLINLHKNIYQVDLRSSHLIKENSIFKFDSCDQMTGFEISNSDQQIYYAYTTEAQLLYKAFIVEKPIASQ